MTREEAKSCIGTIEMLQRLAYNIHGVMDAIDADNCKKIIKALEQEPTTKNDLGVDCVARQDIERYIEGFINEYTPKEELEFINLELDGLKHLPSVTPQESRWIPVSERVAEFPCLACDIFGQIFIPFGVVTLNNRCFDGKEFDFDVEKFLKGKEVTLFSGEKVYEPPKEIVAWMPLPKTYEPQESEG